MGSGNDIKGGSPVSGGKRFSSLFGGLFILGSLFSLLPLGGAFYAVWTRQAPGVAALVLLICFLLTAVVFLALFLILRQKLFTPLEAIVSQLGRPGGLPGGRVSQMHGGERELGELVHRLNQLSGEGMGLHSSLLANGRKLARAESEPAGARQEAETVRSAPSDFLINMSHEIRTPLNGVIATADLALSEDTPEKVKHYLGIIHKSGCKLMEIVEDLFDFSRIEAGRLELNNAPFLLDDVVDSVVSTFMYNAYENNIEFLVDIDPETPGSLLGDRFKIQHVLSNLLSNAFKFTGEFGMIVLAVRDSGRVDAPDRVDLEFAVRDTGVGMTAEQVSKLFQPFTQADTSASRRYEGMGIGLSICENLVKVMGGSLRAESEYGVGSTFTFNVEIERMSSVLGRNREITSGMGQLNVLIADDNAVSVRLLEKIIRSFGFRAVTTLSGLEVLRILEEDREAATAFDLILLDWRMPGLDGIETARKIREELGLEIPVLVMSAFGGTIDLKKKDQGAIAGFLKKPLYASSLFDAIIEIFADRISVSGENGRELVTYDTICMERVKGMKVLVAEDNPSNRLIAKAMLEKADISVSLACNGKEAVAAVEGDDFDAVLMDVQMPEMDGYEATQRIRALPEKSGVTVIAMTANALKGDEERCINAGMNGYLSKPVRQGMLLRALCKRVMYRRGDRSLPEKKRASAPTVGTLPVSMPGLNLFSAMQALNIEHDIFFNILNGFLRSEGDTAEKIRRAFDSGDLSKTRKLAHAIKGSSGAIGAYELNKVSARIEAACEEGQGPGSLLIDEFEQALGTVAGSIRSLRQEVRQRAAGEVERPEALPAGEVDFSDLKQALEASSPGEINAALAALGDLLAEGDRSELEEHIANYDYDRALKKLALLEKDDGSTG